MAAASRSRHKNCLRNAFINRMSTSRTKNVAQVTALVESKASPSPSKDLSLSPGASIPRSGTSFISLEHDGLDDGDDELLPLFDSIVGQLFWNNCERVWIDAAAARSSVVVPALKFAEIVSL